MPGYTQFFGASQDGSKSVVVTVNSQISPKNAPTTREPHCGFEPSNLLGNGPGKRFSERFNLGILTAWVGSSQISTSPAHLAHFGLFGHRIW